MARREGGQGAQRPPFPRENLNVCQNTYRDRETEKGEEERRREGEETE